MNRANALQLLREHMPTSADEYGVRSLALFGSMSRDEARDDSDIDILVSFDGPATSARHFGVQFYLEDLLDHPVDLVIDKPSHYCPFLTFIKHTSSGSPDDWRRQAP